ncbi:hypothetical protein LSAT2_030960, partial [Lamellibrachia satsuma]
SRDPVFMCPTLLKRFCLFYRRFQEYVDCMYPVFMCPTLLKRFCLFYRRFQEYVDCMYPVFMRPTLLKRFCLFYRRFQEYVDCMYPAFMCPTLLKRFWKNYETYKRPPYQCHPRNGTALPKHYKFTTRLTPIGEINSGHQCVANHVVTVCALWILAHHIQNAYI